MSLNEQKPKVTNKSMKCARTKDTVSIAGSEEKYFDEDKYTITLINLMGVVVVEVVSKKREEKCYIPFNNIVYLK